MTSTTTSTNTMRASIYTSYGGPDVLHPAEVARPQPGPKDVLVRVHAHSVNYGDLTARNFPNIPAREFNMPRILRFAAGLSFGRRAPNKQILGSEFAGVVEAVGAQASRFSVGERVFGYLGQSMGASAEYLTIAEDAAIARAPGNVSLEEAATIPYGALMALNLLQKVSINEGDRVLVVGASGGIGSAAVQLARHAGAEVTGVAGTPRLEYVKRLGAHRVIDYKKEEFTDSTDRYDLVFDILGRSSFRAVKRVLQPRGRYLRASFKLVQLLQAIWSGIFGKKKLIVGLAMEKPGDLDTIRELVEAGAYKTVVDRCFLLEEAAEAHRYMESGGRSGAVVVSVTGGK